MHLGAVVNQINIGNGKSDLHYACRNGHTEVAKVLLDAGMR